MAKIEERAKEKNAFIKFGKGIADEDVVLHNIRMEERRVGYIQGATEQKAIDIDKAWQWMVDWVFENAPHEVFDELMSSREDYIKAMEE